MGKEQLGESQVQGRTRMGSEWTSVRRGGGWDGLGGEAVEAHLSVGG